MRRVVVGAVLAAAVVGVAACGGSDSSDSSSSGGSSTAKAADANKHVNIAHFVAIQANPVEQVIIKSAKDTGKANNATVTTFDSNNDVQRELANCQDAIASKKYDAFILKAVSGTAAHPVRARRDGGGHPGRRAGHGARAQADDRAPGAPASSAPSITLSTTNGVAVADLTNKACEKAGANPCKVIYLFGPVAFDYASITRKTFNDTVKAKYPNIKVVAQAAANFDPDTGAQQARQLLQVHPDINVIVNDSDPVRDRDREGRRRPAQGQDHHRGRGRLEGRRRRDQGRQAVRRHRDPARHRGQGRDADGDQGGAQADVGDTTIDVTKDLSPVGTIVDASNVDKYKPEW